MVDAQNKQLVRLSGLSRRLGIPISWLREEADAGRIPSLRAGQTLLFDAGAVERTLLSRAAGEQRGAANE